jgi:hypothetical protein
VAFGDVTNDEPGRAFADCSDVDNYKKIFQGVVVVVLKMLCYLSSPRKDYPLLEVNEMQLCGACHGYVSSSPCRPVDFDNTSRVALQAKHSGGLTHHRNHKLKSVGVQLRCLFCLR